MGNKIRQNLIAAAISLIMATVGFAAAGKIPWLQRLGLAPDLPIYKTRPIKFSHEIHAAKENLDCDSCHTKAATEDRAGMPSVKACINCHDTDEKIEKYLKPFVVDNKAVWTTATALNPDVTFSHKLHLEKQMKCEDCHRGVMTSKGVSIEFRVDKDACLGCHAKNKASAECKVCHQTINRDWKPPTHDLSWKRRHGQAVRSGQDRPYEYRCSLCHTEASCARCHQDEPPQSHTNQWRERGHGVMAGMDRDQCAVCHRADFCDRCHRETEPRSHQSGWGPPQDRHCLRCHNSLSAQGCFTCHQAFPGHVDAPDRPVNATHQTASESACRTCHWLKPPHPDNGDNCRSCHR